MKTFRPSRALALLLASMTLGSLIPCVAGGSALADTDTEAAIKAAILYNFTKVIRWPDRAPGDSTRFVLGIVGGEESRLPFASIDGRRVGAATIEVLPAEEAEDFLSCQMLYISPSEQNQLDAILERLAGSEILTVSEIDDFARRGGVIQLFRHRNRIRFLINLSAAERAHLDLSSQLLKIAEIFREESS